MYKKILVPLDGSKRAETILAHVEELAQRFESEVILLEIVKAEVVYTSINTGVLDIDLQQKIMDEKTKGAKSYLSGLEGELREKGISARSLVEIGSVVQTIIKIADRESTDLIALASHGRTGLSHVFYGSVAAGVLHRVDRPLLLVRAE